MTEAEAVEPTGWLVGYARVSTDDQNLDLQIDALTKYGVPRENIHEDMASGADAKRPGFIAMWKDLRKGDTLVVWRLDRLGRDLSQLMQTADRLREKQVRLVILRDSIDTSTPMGRFMFGVMGAFAQLEREMIVERTRAGLLAARQRGRVGGRRRQISDETLEQVEMMIRDVAEGGEGLSVLEATRKARISTSTFYKWMQEKADARGAADLGE